MFFFFWFFGGVWLGWVAEYHDEYGKPLSCDLVGVLHCLPTRSLQITSIDLLLCAACRFQATTHA